MDMEPNRADEPTILPSQPQQDAPDGIGVWIGVAALTVVLLAFVWLR
jgi:hypothetical protein